MQDPDLLKEALKKYKRENYYVQAWDEYLPELTSLINKVTKYVQAENLTVDAVVPILRGGNIPATFLAYQLKVLIILPVQYKYFFVPGKVELRRLQSLNTDFLTRKDPTLLLVEGNHCYGNQAKYAAEDIKKVLPNSKIIYATSNMDYNYQSVVSSAEISIYGSLTNACKELTDKECARLGLEYKRELLFPWENIAEEWEIVELKQTKYTDVEKLRTNSTLIAEFPVS